MAYYYALVELVTLPVMVASTSTSLNMVEDSQFKSMLMTMTSSTLRTLTSADLPGRKGVCSEILRQEAALRLEQVTL